MWKIGVYEVLIISKLYRVNKPHLLIITQLVIFFFIKNDIDIYFQSLMA